MVYEGYVKHYMSNFHFPLLVIIFIAAIIYLVLTLGISKLLQLKSKKITKWIAYLPGIGIIMIYVRIAPSIM